VKWFAYANAFAGGVNIAIYFQPNRPIANLVIGILGFAVAALMLLGRKA
jgi:hypothetical protein